jgi:hypothetical protein
MPGHLCENKQNAQKVKNKKQKRQNTPNTITAWPEMAGNGVAGLLSDRARGAFLAKCQGIFAKTSRKPIKQQKQKQERHNTPNTTTVWPEMASQSRYRISPGEQFWPNGRASCVAKWSRDPKTNECPESVLSENPPAEIALGRLARRTARAGLLAIGTFWPWGNGPIGNGPTGNRVQHGCASTASGGAPYLIAPRSPPGRVL